MDKPKFLPSDWSARTPEGRRNFLLGNADRTIKDDTIQRQLNIEDQEQLKGILASHSVTLAQIKEEYSKVQKDYNDRMKPHKEAVKNAVTSLMKGYEEVQCDVYLIADLDDNILYKFDDKGEIVHFRKLRPDERDSYQQGIKPVTLSKAEGDFPD